MDICSVTSPSYAAVYKPQGTSPAGTGSFLAQMESARSAPQTQDAVSLSSLSYEQRLVELRKLHESTDYSGMSGKEVVRLIQSRFEETFPNYGAISGGFYLCAGENSIYEKIREEENLQVRDVLNGEKPWEDEPAGLIEYRKYIFGYEGLSDEEIMEQLSEKYSGGTLADRYGMAWEMMNLRLGDHRAAGEVMEQARNEMVQRTEGQYGYLHRDNPLRVNAMIAVGENTTISWTQLVKNCYDDRRDNWTYRSEALKQQILAELKGGLSLFLERLGLSVTDDLFTT